MWLSGTAFPNILWMSRSCAFRTTSLSRQAPANTALYISQALFLYVIEPGGNRIELFGDSGYLIFDPTWKPVRWQASQAAKGIIWIGSDLPKEFFNYGTPIVGSAAAQRASSQQAEEPAAAVTEDVS